MTELPILRIKKDKAGRVKLVTVERDGTVVNLSELLLIQDIDIYVGITDFDRYNIRAFGRVLIEASDD